MITARGVQRSRFGTQLPLIFAIAVAAVAGAGTARAQSSAQSSAQSGVAAQLPTLLPNTDDLPGFVHVIPACETPTGLPVENRADAIRLNHDLGAYGLQGLSGTADEITRAMNTEDGIYQLTVNVRVCDTPETARADLHRAYLLQCQAPFYPGSFTSPALIGDESYFATDPGALAYRLGRVVVIVSGYFTRAGSLGGAPRFPGAVVDAVGEMILLRLANQGGFTSAPLQNATIAMEGRQEPIWGAVLVGSRVYVPVKSFAKAAGWKIRLDGLLRRRLQGTLPLPFRCGLDCALSPCFALPDLYISGSR